MFVSVFLLSESSDGILVAAGCVAEIRLSEPGEEARAAWREPCRGCGPLAAGAARPPER